MKDTDGNPLTSIINLANAAKEFLGKLVTPSIEELGLLIGDQVRSYRFRKQIQILTKARDILEKAGIDPRQVSLKTLVPILEHGSLEEEESMVDRWASLLANAADPTATVKVEPSFTEILKQLSPREAQILDSIYNLVQSIPIPREEWIQRGALAESLKEVLRISEQNFEIAVDNLFRLRLCAPPSTRLDFIDDKTKRFQLNMKDIVCLTEFGQAFVTACRRQGP